MLYTAYYLGSTTKGMETEISRDSQNIVPRGPASSRELPTQEPQGLHVYCHQPYSTILCASAQIPSLGIWKSFCLFYIYMSFFWLKVQVKSSLSFLILVILYLSCLWILFLLLDFNAL